jgi:hypothetical protein
LIDSPLWYHGSRQSFAEFSHDPLAEGDEDRGRYWSARLGLHFAPSWEQASIFCTEYPHDLRTPTAIGQVVTAHLDLQNPLRVTDERLLSLALLAHLLSGPVIPDLASAGPYYVALAAQKFQSEINLKRLVVVFAHGLDRGLQAYADLDPELLDDIDVLADYHALRQPAAVTTFRTALQAAGYDGILYTNVWDEALRGTECAIVFLSSQITVVSIDSVDMAATPPTLA